MSIPRRIFKALRHGYRSMFALQEDASSHEAVEVLRQVSLFQGFSRSALREVAEGMHRRSYKPDEILYYQDDPGLGLYIVERGCVRLVVEDERGDRHELGQVAENEFFGHLSLLGDFRRTETAQSLTETSVLGFFSPNLKTMLKRNPSLGAAIVASLARHLATQQVALVGRVAEAEGKVAALRLLQGVARQQDAAPPVE